VAYVVDEPGTSNVDFRVLRVRLLSGQQGFDNLTLAE
jgi:hypothetical protein